MNPWDSARLSVRMALAAALLAVDPSGLGGVALRGPAGPLRDQWLALLRRLLPPGSPWLRVPSHAGDAALLGGLDLNATLETGRPVAQPGLLARADGGVLVLPMAERVSPGVASRLSAVVDRQQVVLVREGLSLRSPARFALLALDEGMADEERPPAALLDRLALHLLTEPAPEGEIPPDWLAADIERAQMRLPHVTLPEPVLQGLCAAALAWGIDSLRAPLMAVRVARAAAALDGRNEVDDTHAALAAALVLAPRATRMPPPATSDDADPHPSPAEPGPAPQAAASPPAPHRPDEHPADRDAAQDTGQPEQAALEDRLVEAVRASIPPGLLAALQAGQARQARASAAGRAGAASKHPNRGRPVGSRRAEPRSGARLHVLDTLRAAAPWQRLRQEAAGGPARLRVRREDFHVVRYRQHRPTTTVFVVDASGSSALHRLAEAKGAVELLLAECYVRRDRVAVLAFRGAGTELLLPPTRSLTRAKRSLGALPGGGGTPLASGIAAAAELAGQLTRGGDSATVVLLTDGRANIARDGSPGRTQAQQDALAAAQRFRAEGLSALLIDTSPQPSDPARTLAEAMGAAYLALPHAGAEGLAKAVQWAAGPTR
ncbi:magnesium chelatase subunit D [Hydrogenophaga luteola]|uniref:Magnesium chelatase subunit D n=1 Tax=Hydrogenophaga luteola TaxID=1591122 RepID=A0ABV7W7G4_9BURK